MKPNLKIARKEEAEIGNVPEAVDQAPAVPTEPEETPMPKEEKFQKMFIPLFFVELERSNFISMASDSHRFTKDSDQVGKQMLDVLDHFDSAMSIYCTSCHISSHLSELEAEGEIKNMQDLMDHAEHLQAIFNEANFNAARAILGDNAKATKPTVPYADFVERAATFALEKLLKPGTIPEEYTKYTRKPFEGTVEYNSIYKEEALAVVPLMYRSVGSLTKDDAQYFVAASFMRMPLVVQCFEVMRSLLEQAQKEKIQWGPYMHFITVFNASMYAIATMVPEVRGKGDAIPPYLGTILSSAIGGMVQVFAMDNKGAATNLITTIVDESTKMLEEGLKNNADAANTLGALIPEQWPILMKLEAYRNLAIGALSMVQNAGLDG